MSSLSTFLSRLVGVRQSGRSWSARCPAHEDRRNSLSVAEGDDGRILIKCHAGCSAEQIVAAVGLTMRDLAPPADVLSATAVSYSRRSSQQSRRSKEPRRSPGPDACENVAQATLSTSSTDSADADSLGVSASARQVAPATPEEARKPKYRKAGARGRKKVYVGSPGPSCYIAPPPRPDPVPLAAIPNGGPAFTEVYASADLAQAAIELLHAPAEQMWPYHDAQGREIGRILRWQRPCGGKDIRPLALHEDGWRWAGMPEPRPLYRLPEVLRASRVLVTEGEKAADAGRNLGFVCTTSSHGAASAGKTDWTPLAGKLVYLLPDHDEPGRRYIDDVARRLAALSPRPTIKLVELEGLPPGGDLWDWVKQQEPCDKLTIRQALHTQLEEAPAYSFSRPLTAVAPYEPFPTHVLPDPLRRFVVEASDVIGCDPCYLALPLLAGMAAAIGNSRCVELKPGWIEPAILWTAVVGDSGTQKSPALEAALRPVRERQAEAFLAHAEQAAQYEDDLAQYERALLQWKRSAHSNEPPPTRPVRTAPERYWCADTTVEALAPLLVRQPRGLLLVRDELSGWLGGLDRYAKNRGGDAAAWLEMYGGRELLVDRKGDQQALFVPRAAVSVTGGIQPATLRRGLGQEHLENGLAARLLLAWPPRRGRAWNQQGLPEDRLREVALIFHGLYALELEYDEQGAPLPRRLTLDPAAEDAWAKFYNRHAAEQRELEGELAAAWSKLEGACARLALVIQLARDASRSTSSTQIDAASMHTAVRLTQFFAHEARRVYSMLSEPPEERDRRKLIELIAGRGGEITPRDLMRATRRYAATADQAHRVLNDLVQAGHGVWAVPPPASSNGLTPQLFRLLP